MSESDLPSLISKFAATGVLVDANLLLVYLIGLWDVQWIERFMRTQAYSKDDFIMLCVFLGMFQRIVTTPGILAEVNSLANGLPERSKPDFCRVFKAKIDLLEEMHVPGREAAAHMYFDRCGLTDAAIMTVAQEKLLVLTADFRLAGFLDRLKIACINFNHLRFSFE